MSKKIVKLSLTVAILAVFVSGCSLPWQKKAGDNLTDKNASENFNTSAVSGASEKTNQLNKFSDYDELDRFLKDNGARGANAGEIIKTAERDIDFGLSSDNSEASSSAMIYLSPSVKSAGAYESDIVKTDGKYIYALVRDELKIIKADPASEAEIIGTIPFESRPLGIFISGTNLVAFGVDDKISASSIYRNFRRRSPYTFFKVFDLSNPANPTSAREFDFEGYYKDARLVGDYVYLFTESSGAYIEGEPSTPRVIEAGAALSNDCVANEKCFAPDVFYFDVPYKSYNFLNIAAINIKDSREAIKGQSYLMDSGQNLYVSQDNIYITYAETLSEDDLEQSVKRELIFSALSAAEQEKIKAIEAADSYILSADEKKKKAGDIIDNYLSSLSEGEQKVAQARVDEGLRQKLAEESSDSEKTVIYKIAFNGRSLEYRVSGEVPGQVLNQFSLNEDGDYFRIATARSSVWSRLATDQSESYSNIFVLDNELKIVGSLKNLATKEKIYAARFIGDRAYLATFKQTDPFYVIGLANPANPAVLGALRIPGFANYLSPVDKDGNKLISIGHDAADNGLGDVELKGLKISLFDFTDLAKPKELNSFIIGEAGSDSIALSDHQAFLYSEDKNLLAIPAVLKENDKSVFSGSLVFNIIDNKFSLKGKIDHLDAGDGADYLNGHNYYDNTVKRSFYIDSNFFTFSNGFLKINSLDSLAPVKNLALTKGEDDYTITPATDNPVDDTPKEVIDSVENASSSTVSEIIDEPAVSTSTEIN